MKPLSRKVPSIEPRNKEYENSQPASKGNAQEKQHEKRGGFLNCKVWYVQDHEVISFLDVRISEYFCGHSSHERLYSEYVWTSTKPEGKQKIK
jgi:hypothetical protein